MLAEEFTMRLDKCEKCGWEVKSVVTRMKMKTGKVLTEA